MQVMPMTAAYAADIATWRYPPPYDCYDMAGVAPAALGGTDSGFFALTDAPGLIGFRSFGSDGRVPGGTYDDSALDTGGGLRPELTGQGLGRQAIQTGLAYGLAQFSTPAFRARSADSRQPPPAAGMSCSYGPSQNDGQVAQISAG